MIFSAPGRERLALNEISLWSGGANPGGGYGYGPDAGTNQFGNYLPFGDLFVDFKKATSRLPSLWKILRAPWISGTAFIK